MSDPAAIQLKEANEPLQVVWFKRDLRIHDHGPLVAAAQRGVVLPLYVVEPQLWAQRDASARQWNFIAECLQELREQLAELGQPLVVRMGEMLPVLKALQRQRGIAGLWSHEETGNAFTYRRDLAVGRWCKQQGIQWHETPSSGVIRRLKDRDGWARVWEQRMKAPQSPTPTAIESIRGMECGVIPSADDLKLAVDPCPERQRGGRSQALDLLDTFLHQRGRAYARELSSPLTAFRSCSRLSAHLSYGTVSMREVVQIGRAQGAPRAFIERLHWHCHFIQKLESQPSLEFRNAHRAYDGLRCTDPVHLNAWSEGQTGWPFVDACMRALRHHGWINFRMRAMLMAVASYHLWIDWRDSGAVLARLFVDYEPGIHWNQCQMQSGTTGINTVRIYNPIKQGQDHDPEGHFIRRWLPELAAVPVVHLHMPWQMSDAEQHRANCRLGTDYPLPLLDYAEAAKQARDRVWALRKGRQYRCEADAIQKQHGSRRGNSDRQSNRHRRRRSANTVSNGQLELDFS